MMVILIMIWICGWLNTVAEPERGAGIMDGPAGPTPGRVEGVQETQRSNLNLFHQAQENWGGSRVLPRA